MLYSNVNYNKKNKNFINTFKNLTDPIISFKITFVPIFIIMKS